MMPIHFNILLLAFVALSSILSATQAKSLINVDNQKQLSSESSSYDSQHVKSFYDLFLEYFYPTKALEELPPFDSTASPTSLNLTDEPTANPTGRPMNLGGGNRPPVKSKPPPRPPITGSIPFSHTNTNNDDDQNNNDQINDDQTNNDQINNFNQGDHHTDMDSEEDAEEDIVDEDGVRQLKDPASHSKKRNHRGHHHHTRHYKTQSVASQDESKSMPTGTFVSRRPRSPSISYRPHSPFSPDRPHHHHRSGAPVAVAAVETLKVVAKPPPPVDTKPSPGTKPPPGTEMKTVTKPPPGSKKSPPGTKPPPKVV
jgi:hypothetical protein